MLGVCRDPFLAEPALATNGSDRFAERTSSRLTF